MAVENSFHNEFNIKNGEKTMSWAYRSGIVVLKITTRRTTIGVRKSLDTSGKNLTTGPPRHVRKSPDSPQPGNRNQQVTWRIHR